MSHELSTECVCFAQWCPESMHLESVIALQPKTINGSKISVVGVGAHSLNKSCHLVHRNIHHHTVKPWHQVACVSCNSASAATL